MWDLCLVVIHNMVLKCVLYLCNSSEKSQDSFHSFLFCFSDRIWSTTRHILLYTRLTTTNLWRMFLEIPGTKCTNCVRWNICPQDFCQFLSLVFQWQEMCWPERSWPWPCILCPLHVLHHFLTDALFIFVYELFFYFFKKCITSQTSHFVRCFILSHILKKYKRCEGTRLLPF